MNKTILSIFAVLFIGIMGAHAFQPTVWLDEDKAWDAKVNPPATPIVQEVTPEKYSGNDIYGVLPTISRQRAEDFAACMDERFGDKYFQKTTTPEFCMEKIDKKEMPTLLTIEYMTRMKANAHKRNHARQEAEADALLNIPQGLTAVPGGINGGNQENRIKLDWEIVNLLATYNVYKDGVITTQGNWKGPTTFVSTGLNPDTTYNYAVSSVIDGKESAKSNEVSATTASLN